MIFLHQNQIHLCLCLCFFFSALIKSSQLHFQLAIAGEDVTLSCSCPRIAAVEYYWFKQRVGPSPQLVTKCFSLNDYGTFSEEFNNPRFSLDVKQPNYQLNISNLTISDSATYYCLAGNLRTSDFCEGTTLTVKSSGVNISASVYHLETTQPGEPETLSCTIETLTCGGEHSVYWFRNSGESHPGLIYTQGGSDDQCLGKPNGQTQVCEFNLPMERLQHSHVGTYYCAIAACRQIIFGDKSNIDVKSESSCWSKKSYIDELRKSVLSSANSLQVVKTHCSTCTSWDLLQHSPSSCVCVWPSQYVR